MVHLARRNLFQNKIRLGVSVGGVALALVLILALDAILVGVEQRITSYIDSSGADIWVSEAGVRNLHMASSALQTSTLDGLRRVPGVVEASPILYASNTITVGGRHQSAYVFGLPAGSEMGAPKGLVVGDRVPGPGEAVIDRGAAATLGVEIDETVDILGRSFRLIGMSTGGTSLTNSTAFISMDDFARSLGNAETVSFVLVRVEPGLSAATVAARIEASTVGVTAQTRQQFANQERRIVRDMTTDIVNIMNLVGFLIGLAVMALTVYSATLSRRAEYGVLKALGSRNHHLYGIVLSQALISVVLGLIAGLTVTAVLSIAVPRFAPSLALQLSGPSVLKVAAMSLVIAGIAAMLPIWQLARLDPAVVFRGGQR